MVSAIPLPRKEAPVDKSVLAPEEVSPAPVPPSQGSRHTTPARHRHPRQGQDPTGEDGSHPGSQPTQAPPTRPRHRQGPVRESATQLPQSVTQTKNGDAAATIEDKAFGNRYAYYRDIVSRTVSQNWYTSEADPNASQGKHVILSMDIQRMVPPPTSTSSPAAALRRSTPPPCALSSASTASVPSRPEIT